MKSDRDVPPPDALASGIPVNLQRLIIDFQERDAALPEDARRRVAAPLARRVRELGIDIGTDAALGTDSSPDVELVRQVAAELSGAQWSVLRRSDPAVDPGPADVHLSRQFLREARGRQRVRRPSRTMFEDGCVACGGVLDDRLACRLCSQLVSGPIGVRLAGIGQRLGAYLADVLVIALATFVVLIVARADSALAPGAVAIGALAVVTWWLIAFGTGQTPGKQLVGVRAALPTGETAGWGRTFLREFVMKGLVTTALSVFTFGIVGLLAMLWALWDRDRQTLYDKMAGTIVISGTPEPDSG